MSIQSRTLKPRRDGLWGALLIIALTFALAAAGCASPAAPKSVPGEVAALPVQPEVLALAAEQPRQMLPIIVQARSSTGDAVARMAALGGRVVQDLHLINGFAAQLPASALAEYAQTPDIRWISLDAPMVPAQTRGDLESRPAFITWATNSGARIANTYYFAWNMTDSPLGPSKTYAIGNQAGASFSGFKAEVSAGYKIAKVEAVLVGYAIWQIANPIKLSTYIDGKQVSTGELAGAGFNEHIGEANAGPVYVDVTGTRQWQWGDFDRALELVLDQTKAGGLDWIYYDAIGLRVWIQPGTEKTDYPLPVEDTSSIAIDPTRQVNVYNKVINVEPLWQWNRRLQGNGVGVAVVDSGVERTGDLAHLKVIDMNFNPGFHDSQDRFGHGTFVAGVIAGSGNSSGGIHVGVAPRSRLLNIRVSDDSGRATASDVVAGLQWVYENAARYNIRVVNMSLNSSVAASYLTDPLCAAAEMLWLRGIVVVVSAGNNGTATLYPPANDPFVITVGATDDKGTAGMTDDTMASFSGYGVTELGSAKPDLVAPGRNIVAYLPYNKTLRMPNEHPNNRVTDSYFRMSGTSVSAPMVTGAVALLLQDEPYLTPNQVKFRLMSTANKNWPGYDPQRSGAGYVDAYAAVNGWTFDNANNGLPVSKILWDSLAGTAWSSVNWNSVNWNSVNWNSVNWNSVNWNSVNWNSVNWNSVNWNSVNWNSDYWETMSAADATEIPAVARLFELLEEQPGATPEVPGKVYLPSVNR